MSNQPAQVSTERDELPRAQANAGTNRHNRHEATHRRHIITRFAALWLVAAGVLCTSQSVMAQVVEGQFYRIKNVGSQKYLSVALGEAPVEGAQIVQRAQDQDLRQQWSFVKQRDVSKGAVFKVINRKSGQALNVQGESTDDGAPIIQWDANVRGKNQRWTIEQHGAHFALKARHSDKVIDVVDESKERKAAIIQSTFRNAQTQLFELEPVQ